MRGTARESRSVLRQHVIVWNDLHACRGGRTASARRSGTGPAEETDHPREVIEAALAHVIQNKVEAAYARSDLFERRRRLMDDWAAYLASTRGRVVPLRR